MCCTCVINKFQVVYNPNVEETANSKMCHWVPVYSVYICFTVLCVPLLISDVTKNNMEISAANFKSRLLDFSV
jgi:uncharacterized Tic20 family protein